MTITRPRGMMSCRCGWWFVLLISSYARRLLDPAARWRRLQPILALRRAFHYPRRNNNFYTITSADSSELGQRENTATPGASRRLYDMVRKYEGSSRTEFRRISGLAARKRAAVGNGPRTPIARTPALWAISMSSAVSPT